MTGVRGCATSRAFREVARSERLNFRNLPLTPLLK
jgi:hypothetical protein